MRVYLEFRASFKGEKFYDKYSKFWNKGIKYNSNDYNCEMRGLPVSSRID